MNTVAVEQAVELIRTAQSKPGSVEPVALRAAVETVVRITAATYTRESETYVQARASRPWEQDAYMTARLLGEVRSRISGGEMFIPAGQKWRLLDVGAGYGRDVLRFAQERDINPVGVDNAPGFVAELRRLQNEGQLGLDSVVAADMRDMTSISSSSFHCVRNHATLHHLPVLSGSIGADVAVSECRRVLVEGGVFYVTVKSGDGVSMIDTKEGLGGRFFQLFTRPMLRDLLGRHGLNVVHLEELVEPRGATDVSWLFALAIAA